MIRVGQVSLLRGYGNSPEHRAVIEGIVRYKCQGGGQEHTGQLRDNYSNTTKKKKKLLFHNTLSFSVDHSTETCTLPPLNQVRELTRKSRLPDERDAPERNS